jgi:hypothetical protein
MVDFMPSSEIKLLKKLQDECANEYLVGLNFNPALRICC